MRSGSLGTTIGRLPKVGVDWVRAAGSRELAGVVAVDVVGVLQDVAGEDRDHIRVARMTPAAVSLRMPASVAAEAGSQPMPHWPIMRLGVGDLLLGHLLHHAVRRAHLVQRFGPRDRIADLDGGGQRLGMLRRRESSRPSAAHAVRRTARRLRPESRRGAASGRSDPSARISRSALPNAEMLPRLPPGSTIQSGAFQSRWSIISTMMVFWPSMRKGLIELSR